MACAPGSIFTDPWMNVQSGRWYSFPSSVTATIICGMAFAGLLCSDRNAGAYPAAAAASHPPARTTTVMARSAHGCLLIAGLLRLFHRVFRTLLPPGEHRSEVVPAVQRHHDQMARNEREDPAHRQKMNDACVVIERFPIVHSTAIMVLL